MAIRTDITVNYLVSPRIATIAAPSTDVTIQDLYDTLASDQAQIQSTPYKIIVKGDGKADLGSGLFTVVTCKLLNTKLKFADRAGPGLTLCKVTNGNLVAVDANNNSIHPIETSTNTHVTIVQATTGGLINLLSVAKDKEGLQGGF